MMIRYVSNWEYFNGIVGKFDDGSGDCVFFDLDWNTKKFTCYVKHDFNLTEKYEGIYDENKINDILNFEDDSDKKIIEAINYLQSIN